MNRHNRELKRYFKEIRKECHMYANGYRFYKQLREEVNSYISATPDLTIDDIYKKYGTPSELADTLFQQIDLQTYKKKTLIAKYIKRFLFFCVIATTIMLLCIYIDHRIHRPAIINYTIEYGK